MKYIIERSKPYWTYVIEVEADTAEHAVKIAANGYGVWRVVEQLQTIQTGDEADTAPVEAGAYWAEREKQRAAAASQIAEMVEVSNDLH
jgi:hypothetical protein